MLGTSTEKGNREDDFFFKNILLECNENISVAKKKS